MMSNIRIIHGLMWKKSTRIAIKICWLLGIQSNSEAGAFGKQAMGLLRSGGLPQRQSFARDGRLARFVIPRGLAEDVKICKKSS